MENLCKLFQKSDYSFTELAICPCDELNFDIENLGKKYHLTLLYHDESLYESKNYGPELFVRKVDDRLIAHSNPAKATKLPAGLNKINGAKTLDEVLGTRFKMSHNWEALEKELDHGINIWGKENLGLNKSSVTNYRRAKKFPAIDLHLDKKFGKLFLITCSKVYFRRNVRKIKQNKIHIEKR